jgi:molybdopterin/thiamine biosynthesis adenylyltransferase
LSLLQNKNYVPAPELTAELRAGRRALEGLNGVEILEDFVWDGQAAEWLLRVRLIPETFSANEYVPAETDWFVSLSALYPRGRIKFRPDKENGLKHTFPHQHINLSLDQSKWRSGDLCLDKAGATLNRQTFADEPFEADWRLQWHVLRALYWLEDASHDRLFKKGDPFELPQFPVNPYLSETVVFVESSESVEFWKATDDQIGIVEYYLLPGDRRNFLVKAFLRLDGKPILMPPWGDFVLNANKHLKNGARGIWIRLKETPIVAPWQAPTNWREMRDVCRAQGTDLDEMLSKVYSRAKLNDNLTAPFLIGFPIPEKVGEPAQRFHWQGLKLPNLKASDANIPGFRSKGKWAAKYNREMVLHDNLPLDWLDSENWFPDQLRSRGTLPESLRDKNVCLIGAGAIASMVGELLVRGGVDQMAIIDADVIKAGNLVRHNLDLRQLGQNKARALADRLNRISPFARIDAVEENFLPRSQKAIERIIKCDLVVDCTGSDDALFNISKFEFRAPTRFVSLSVNLGATRLYFYSAEENPFSFETFKHKIKPWLRDEETKSTFVPREGIGCWHPVFPARADDMWLFASVAVKKLNGILSSTDKSPKLIVFEQQTSEDGFFGLKELRTVSFSDVDYDEKYGILVA